LEILLKKNIKFFFYPSIPFEVQEDKNQNSNYNCPIVTSYSEVLKKNIDRLRQDNGIIFMNPFLPIDDKKCLIVRLIEELQNILTFQFKKLIKLLKLHGKSS
jgi:predicted nucleotide-binding protein (sugar kinase/HSP70/actin superfamily)